MRNLLVAAALALLSPAAASAQMNVGVKLGLAFPGGDKWSGYPMTTEIGMAVPIEASLNLALAPQLEVGVYGGYAFIQPDSSYSDYCDLNGGSCDEHLWRLGVKTEYAFGSGQAITPFVGANFGFAWDMLDESVPAAGYDFTHTLRGWELGFELGADAWMSQASKVGAFIGLAFGEYNWERIDGIYAGSSVSHTGSFSDTATHTWFTVGVRGSFGM
jgi:hypothetical protein